MQVRKDTEKSLSGKGGGASVHDGRAGEGGVSGQKAPWCVRAEEGRHAKAKEGFGVGVGEGPARALSMSEMYKKARWGTGGGSGKENNNVGSGKQEEEKEESIDREEKRSYQGRPGTSQVMDDGTARRAGSALDGDLMEVAGLKELVSELGVGF